MIAPARSAVFLDRDGVIVEDCDLLVDPADIRILADVPAALRRLHHAGLKLIVVTNQAVVARGLATTLDIDRINAEIVRQLCSRGAPAFDAIYFCPHHPQATLEEFRNVCECRKPRPGMLRRAALDHVIDLPSSFMVGDRMTDIAAGQQAGCRTALVRTGRHGAAPIVTVDPLDPKMQPDHVCRTLTAAVDWILENR